jgi:hypothetical protein
MHPEQQRNIIADAKGFFKKQPKDGFPYTVTNFQQSGGPSLSA